MRRAPPAAVALLAILGTGVLVLNLYGTVSSQSRHDLALEYGHRKGPASLEPPQRVLARLRDAPAEIESRSDAVFVTMTIASGIRHYWPSPGEVDPEVFYGFSENWAIATVQRLELTLLRAGLISTPKSLRLERVDYRSSIEKGVGFCSQATLAVVDYLQRRGVPAQVTGLDGHVVAEARIADHHYVLDADYAVTIPHSVAQIQRAPQLIEPYYRAAGYVPEVIANLVSIYGPEGNRPYDDKFFRVMAVLDVVKWAVPLGAIALAVFLYVRGHDRRRHHGAAPSTPDSQSGL